METIVALFEYLVSGALSEWVFQILLFNVLVFLKNNFLLIWVGWKLFQWGRNKFPGWNQPKHLIDLPMTKKPSGKELFKE